jgi:hypothetical protein
MRYPVLTLLFIAVINVGCNRETTPGQSKPTGQGMQEKNAPVQPTTFTDTSGNTYAWLQHYDPANSLQNRIPPPDGYTRLPLPKGSFAAWLRGLPLKPGKPNVMLFNGAKKENQEAQYAVLDIDAGKRDLQQCADAVMRLRAEYLYAAGLHDAIHFNFTNGENCPWSKWKAGYRATIGGAKTTWTKKAEASESHPNFRAYLDLVYTYAGTASLEKELTKIGTLSRIEIGDVFIQGGFPGHAVLVVDIAENPENGKRMYMMVQSYMPAQDIHVLNNLNHPDIGPWYDATASGPVETPEWTFLQQDLRRFQE